MCGQGSPDDPGVGLPSLATGESLQQQHADTPLISRTAMHTSAVVPKAETVIVVANHEAYIRR